MNKIIIAFVILFASAVIGHMHDGMDYVTESMGEEDFELESLMEKDMMEGIKGMEEGTKSMDDVMGIMCKDVSNISKEMMDVSGRSAHKTFLPQRFCGKFCLEFYNFCRSTCFQLIQQDGVKYFEILPCLTSCVTHFASCCFS